MAPEVTVVVPSHDRPLRLRWLLNALEEQTIDPARFEVVVVHDSAGAETEELLRDHPLARSGSMRRKRLAPGTGRPGRQRDEGWRLARAPLIAFTDDDCRPDARWLEELLAAAREHPHAIVQGRIEPDPFEAEVMKAPHHRTLSEPDPPGPYAQTANILYPREALERVGGFAPSHNLNSGEDTDLAWRVRGAGFAYAGAPAALVYHAVEDLGLRGTLRVTRKWADLAYVVREHPEVRGELYRGVFWRRSHASLIVASAGAVLALRHPAFALLALPYLRDRVPRPWRPRSFARDALRLPANTLIDAAEVVTCARGSIRHRTLFL